MNLRMIYTCNMKSSGKYERRKEGECTLLCIVNRNHEISVVILDHFWNFKGIQLIVEQNIENEEIILIQGKENFCAKLKKRKLKTKKLLKITILDEQEPSVQSADRTKAVQV